ncbi:DUF4339 domain-containing protein [Fuerstiella marisgermanici]|uniref:GYF domain-containing protein n=1 Tax=Fuerstiella marisgermanici TaxID=1891926 RepID=A0A1P8WER4_9PLAN|nr:DUF4339 domain-containing protein [Fuerstiella marisgermanici]APZ92555.1 hypothetical protein Fuma_02166 [Fuerstiella marisgermanici]
MARYWIRNRGRVQGPFSEERIQGLLRRGRFSRHFHVSEDRKNWYPAGDFPELFAEAGGPEPDDEDGHFRSGGSPFDDDEDDDYDDPPERSRRKTQRASKPQATRRRTSVPDDDDDDIRDEHDDDDEDWEGDDTDGVLTGLVDWIESNVKVLAVVLLLVLGVLSWFAFMKEDFTQDTADLKTLQGYHSQIVRAHQTGAAADQWIPMMERILTELAPLVERLDENASAMDHVKQKLLFVARDDIPRMLKELPVNKQDAAQRVMQQLELVDNMIQQQTRFSEAGSLTAPQLIPPRAPQPNPPPAGQTPLGEAPPGATPPAEAPGTNNSGTNSTGASSPGTNSPGTGNPASSIPGTGRP